jgi:hypothetical protein
MASRLRTKKTPKMAQAREIKNPARKALCMKAYEKRLSMVDFSADDK